MLDALIVGGGYTGSLLALALARSGRSVAVVDGSAHPRYAVGEGATAEQNRVHAWLGRELGVPELAALGSYPRLRRAGLPLAAWPKEGLYFLADPARAGGEAAPPELFFQTVPWPVGPDYHVSRAHLDLLLAGLARRAGAEWLGASRVEELDLDDPVRARVSGPTGDRELRARLLVDASGFGCFLGERLGLVDRDPPGALRTRSVYGLFSGVAGVEEALGRAAPRLPVRRDHATVHLHWPGRDGRPGGWAWVIALDHGIASVGVVVDADEPVLPEAGASPWAELRAIAEGHGPFARMMARARPLRPLVRTGRMQFAVARTVGRNWVILPPAAGFSDPILSPGMAVAAAGAARVWHAHAALFDRAEPADVALAAAAETWRREATWVGRVQQVMRRALGDPASMGEALRLYRLAVLVGGLDLAGGAPHPWLAALWGFDHAPLQRVVAAVEDAQDAALAAGAPGPEVARAMREALREHDVYGYVGSAFDQPVRPGIYTIRASAQARWMAGLLRADDRELRAAARRELRRWVASLPGKARAPALGRPRLRDARSPGGIALRHLLIGLGWRG